MYCKTLSSRSVLAAVLASTALMLGSTGALAQAAADDADAQQQTQQKDSAPASDADSDATTSTGGTADDAADAPDAAGTSEVATEGGFITQQESSQTLATSVIGVALRDGDGDDAQTIGKVTDLVLNDDKELVGVVVGVGGFLGVGQKSVGIPWGEVKQLDPDGKTAVVNLTKDELKDAPEFVTVAEQQKQEEAERQKNESAQQSSSGGGGAVPPTPTE